MEGFDLLGAASTELAKEYITLRVKSIDADKLKNKLGGSTGKIASSALPFINSAPIVVLHTAAPLVIKKAKDYGVDLEMSISTAPPEKFGKASSEFLPGFLVGGALGLTVLTIVKLFARLFQRS